MVAQLPGPARDHAGGAKAIIPVFQVNESGEAAGALPPLGRAAAAASLPTVLSNEDLAQLTALLAAVGGKVVSIVPSCNTDTHGAGDIVAATEILAAITRADDVPGILASMTCARLDSATGPDIRVWVLKANVSFGAESGPKGIADADMDDILGYVDFASADFKSGGSTNCFAQKTNVHLPIIPATGSDDIYFAIEALAALTLGAATSLVLNFHRI